MSFDSSFFSLFWNVLRPPPLFQFVIFKPLVSSVGLSSTISTPRLHGVRVYGPNVRLCITVSTFAKALQYVNNSLLHQRASMEPAKQSPNMTLFSRGGSPYPSADPSPRDKRYLAQVEKALASFESVEEWADYIAFLSRLKKALAVPSEKAHSITWLPCAEQVSGRLSLCLSPSLPNGVHQKALELYTAIFNTLTVKVINNDISLWLPGLLPVLSYGSMQVKPQLISLLENNLLKFLDATTLKTITKPFILSLLCGLEDENAEIYSEALNLLDSFKSKLENNSHFWQTFFFCITACPEKRIGALTWCLSRLPNFTTINLGSDRKFSAEAEACLSPAPGLVVRAFAAALNTHSNFNQANDIIVMRGFFDLLLSHLPLDSPVISEVISPEEKQLLIMACCKVTLRKDMSLNRRLWKWLLGPESADESVRAEDHKAYFATHALPFIKAGLLSLIGTDDASAKLEAYKMSLALIMDRWEISQLMSPVLFVPILQSCFSSYQISNSSFPEILLSAKRFFDEVETVHIWRYIICDLICPGDEKYYEMIKFIIKNFDVPDDERTLHVPLALVAFLLSHDINERSISILEILVDLAQPALFNPLSGEKDLHTDDRTVLSLIKDYYTSLGSKDFTESPIEPKNISTFLMNNLQKWFVESTYNSGSNGTLATILCEFLDSIPQEDGTNIFADRYMIKAFLDYPEFSCDGELSVGLNTSAVFGLAKLCRFVLKVVTVNNASKILKIILSNLWATLISPYPADHQVEAVRCIFDLQVCFDSHEIEAGILFMLLQTPSHIRTQSFYKLWSHSTDLNGAETLLSNSLFVVLDSLRDDDISSAILGQKFVFSISTDGSANRFLQILANPILKFPLVQENKSELSSDDDLKLFAYYFETILAVVKSNEKVMKDSFTHEFVASETTEKFHLFTSNGWHISNYKSLLLNIIQKFFKLRLKRRVLEDKRHLESFIKCIASAIKLYCLFITGSESDFENYFTLLVESCKYFISGCAVRNHELEIVVSLYIEGVLELLTTAKSVDENVMRLKDLEDPESPLLIRFIIVGLENCISPILLEKWFKLLNKSLYLLDIAIFKEVLPVSETIISRINFYFNSAKAFEKIDECSDIESSINICLSGLEDLLSISHSYLISPKMSSNLKNTQGENGFLGNVISGVFQIESPLVKSEEEQRTFSTIAAFHDATKMAFEIWTWADGKPQVTNENKSFVSQISITQMSNKLKFRSRKLLECISELERQEIIETILESQHPTECKIKILHVLDSGHSHLTLPHILNSIISRCFPSSLSEKDRSSMFSTVTEKQLGDFLDPYYASIDVHSFEDIWDMSVSFFKEVSSHPLQFKSFLIPVLNVIKILSSNSRTRSNDNKRNSRDLPNYFITILNSSVSKKANLIQGEKSNLPEDSGLTDAYLTENLVSLIESLGDILMDADKVSTAITTIISAIVVPHLKAKSAVVPATILEIMEAIGINYPIKPWKQVIYDSFMDNSFFQIPQNLEVSWRKVVSLWIVNDKDKFNDFLNKVTPPTQPSAANIFIWNENSEVEDRVYVLKRIAYLIMAQPHDTFIKYLKDLMSRLAAAMNNSCPALYKSAAITVFRAISLKFSEGHLLPYWTFIIQTLIEVFSVTSKKITKQGNALEADELSLLLSACKLIDQLLLAGFDEINLASWLFVSRGSISDVLSTSDSLIDCLGSQTESLLIKEDAIAIQGPRQGEKSKPLLLGVTQVKNVALLKRFFGSLGYINFERSYGLYEPDLESCENDVRNDLFSD